jgi:hypothetical protein
LVEEKFARKIRKPLYLMIKHDRTTAFLKNFLLNQSVKISTSNQTGAFGMSPVGISWPVWLKLGPNEAKQKARTMAAATCND